MDDAAGRGKASNASPHVTSARAVHVRMDYMMEERTKHEGTELFYNLTFLCIFNSSWGYLRLILVTYTFSW